MTRAYRALSVTFFFHLLPLLSPIFLIATKPPGGKRNALIAVVISVADVLLLAHSLGMFLGTITMIIAAAPLLSGLDAGAKAKE